MKKKSERIIYQSAYFSKETLEEIALDYKEELIANGASTERIEELIANEDALYEHQADRHDIWCNDEMCNLDTEINTKIIAIASVGLWNGRHTGYKELSYNLSDIFRVWDSCDYIKLSQKNGNIIGKGIHHDGTNYVTFRKWVDNVSDENKDKVLDALYDGKDNFQSLVKRYTRSIAPDIKAIYGW